MFWLESALAEEQNRPLEYLVFPHMEGEGNLYSPGGEEKEMTVKMWIQVDLRKYIIKDETEDISDKHRLTFGDSELALQADWQDQLRAIVKMNLAHLFKYDDHNKIDWNEDWDINSFVESAYIEIRNEGDWPVVVLVGRRDINLGLHNLTDIMPMSYSFWEDFQQKYGSMSLTVSFQLNGGLADEVELTVYEGDTGDFNIEEDSAGALIRLRKRFGSVNAVATYSTQKYRYTRRVGLNNTKGRLGSLGFEADFNDKLKGWIEGLYFFSAPLTNIVYGLEGSWAFSTGLSYELKRGVFLTGNFNYIDKMTEEYGLELKMSPFFGSEWLKKNSDLRFQLYYSQYPELDFWEPDTYFGIQWRISADAVLFQR